MRLLHPALALFYLAQAGVLLFLSASYSVGVTGTYLAKDTLQSMVHDKTVFAPASEHLFDISLRWLVVVLLLVMALTHIVLTVLSRRQGNERTDGARRLHWAGIGVSGAFVAVLLALTIGLRDITLLVSLIGLTSLVSVAGFLLETRQQMPRRALYTLAGIAALTPWIVLAVGIIMGAEQGSLSAWLQWLFVVPACWALLLYAGVYQLYAGRRPLKLEATIFISLVIFGMYSCLAWQTYAALLHV